MTAPQLVVTFEALDFGADGRNIALKVPPHQYEATVRFTVMCSVSSH